MPKPSHDPSIQNEPHLRGNSLDKLDSETVESNPYLTPEKHLRNPLETPLNVDPNVEGVDHTVWDEPTHLSNPESVEAPEGEITFARWLEAGIQNTSWIESLSITLMLIFAAGPWGIIGAIISGSSASGAFSWAGVLSAGVLAPVTEEITKVAALLWVVEKRPYWFKSLWQILIAAIAGGAMFAVIENLIYINFYVPNGNADFRSWRWTVCTGLHVNCSFLAGVGLVRIWDNAIRNRARPELALGMPFFAMAMIGHGLYNFGVTFAEALGWLTFE